MKITGPDGNVHYTTECDASPEEHRLNLERAQLHDFFYSRFLQEGKDPMTPEAREEIQRMVDEEMERQRKAAITNVIPFPKQDDIEKQERGGAQKRRIGGI